MIVTRFTVHSGVVFIVDCTPKDELDDRASQFRNRIVTEKQ